MAGGPIPPTAPLRDLEELDADLEPADAAYVLVYGSQMPSDPSDRSKGPERFVCVARAEVRARYAREAFGVTSEFVTTETDVGGRAVVMEGVPGCCVFATPPSRDELRAVMLANRRLVRNFAPRLEIGAGERLLCEIDLFKISSQAAGGSTGGVARRAPECVDLVSDEEAEGQEEREESKLELRGGSLCGVVDVGAPGGKQAAVSKPQDGTAEAGEMT
eukprot:evm.model.scf_1663.7 EVM.evm.TU.scf_1663.7   scf_1663:34431-35081(+)